VGSGAEYHEEAGHGEGEGGQVYLPFGGLSFHIKLKLVGPDYLQIDGDYH
jgi:hypothetical protein